MASATRSWSAAAAATAGRSPPGTPERVVPLHGARTELRSGVWIGRGRERQVREPGAAVDGGRSGLDVVVAGQPDRRIRGR